MTVARYFELFDDMISHTRWPLDSPVDERGDEIDPWQFKKGKVLELGCVPRFLIQQHGDPLEFSLTAFTIPLVHERVVRIGETPDAR